MPYRSPRPGRLQGRRSAGFVLLCLLVPFVSACERGCLTKAIEEKKQAVESPLDLTGTDCPVGLYRCSGGHLERSVGGHIPAKCERGESCRCPFVPEGECERGCLVEDTELLMDDGGAALCVTPGSRSVPVLAPAEPCDTDDVVCVNGAIVRCSPTPRTVARCLRGCSGQGSLDPETQGSALDVLCQP